MWTRTSHYPLAGLHSGCWIKKDLCRKRSLAKHPQRSIAVAILHILKEFDAKICYLQGFQDSRIELTHRYKGNKWKGFIDMRISVVFNSDSEIVLHVQYNHILQCFMYKNQLDRDYSQFLHQDIKGASNGKFNLFTFSRLMGKFKFSKETGKITLFPSSREAVNMEDKILFFSVRKRLLCLPIISKIRSNFSRSPN